MDRRPSVPHYPLLVDWGLVELFLVSKNTPAVVPHRVSLVRPISPGAARDRERPPPPLLPARVEATDLSAGPSVEAQPRRSLGAEETSPNLRQTRSDLRDPPGVRNRLLGRARVALE